MVPAHWNRIATRRWPWAGCHALGTWTARATRIRCTRPASSTNRARPASIVIVARMVLQRRAQVVPEDILADLPPLLGARLLVESEVDAAVDAGVVDVVGDLL